MSLRLFHLLFALFIGSSIAVQTFCVNDCNRECPTGEIVEMEVLVHSNVCYLEWHIEHKELLGDFDNESTPVYICSINNHPNLECELKCTNTSNTGQCNGDAFYLEVFGPAVNSECFCKTYKLTGQDESYLVNGNELTNFSFEFKNVTKVYEVQHLAHPLVSSSLDEYILKVVTDTVPLECIISKDHFSELQPVSKSPFQEILTDQATAMSGTLDIKCYYSGAVVHVNSFYVYGKKKCEMVDGFNPFSLYKNFKCSPTSYQFWFVMLHLGYFFFLLFCCSGVLACMGKSVACVFKPLITCIYMIKKVTNKKVKKTWNNLKKEAENSDEDKDQPPIKMADIKNRYQTISPALSDDLGTARDIKTDSIGKYYINPKGSRRYIEIFAIILLIPLVLCNEPCDSVGTITTLENSCVISGNNKTCSFKPNVQLTFNAVGETSCLDIKNGEEMLGQLRITYSELIAEFSLLNQYSTCDSYITSTSVHRCRTRGNCVDDKCETMLPYQKDLYGETNNVFITDYPGKAQCRRGCGCGICGCGSCKDGCIFSAYSILPKGPCGVVYKPGNLMYHQKLKVSFRTNIGNYSTETIMDNGYSNLGGMIFSIVGLFQQTIYNFNEEHVLESGPYRLVRASKANFPTKKTIGDIQGHSIDAIWGQSTSAFIFDHDMVTRADSDKSDIYTLESGGMLSAQQYPTFPLSREGEIWQIQEGKMFSNITSSAKLLVNLKSNTVGQITSQVNMICPHTEFVEIDGCYSCNKVSSMKLRVSSSCESGYCSITCSGLELIQKSILLTKEILEYHVSFRHGLESVKADCEVHCNGGQDRFTVVGTLEKEDDLKNETENAITSNSQGKAQVKSKNWFENLIGHYKSWVAILIYIGFAIIGIIGVVITTKVLITVVSAKRGFNAFNSLKGILYKQKV